MLEWRDLQFLDRIRQIEDGQHPLYHCPGNEAQEQGSNSSCPQPRMYVYFPLQLRYTVLKLCLLSLVIFETKLMTNVNQDMFMEGYAITANNLNGEIAHKPHPSS